MPEPFAENNDAEWSTQVLDPYRSDLRVTASGPPILVPGGQAHYNLYLDNIGGLAAATSTLTATLPAELEFLSASIPPVTISPLIWDFGTLPPLSPLTPLIITAQVASNTPPGVNLTVYAAITTTTPDSNPNNNSANVTIATSLSDARTLFLVAPDRLASRYGASPLMGELYQLAQHPLVEGAILDVTGEPAVAAAYTAWDADPGNWQRANEVAEAIKTLIDQYTIAYPNLQYLVIVGGDEIIPFYRLADQNSTVWQEDDYAPYLRPSTVQSALASNRLLTDDFYADRLPTTVNSPFWFDGHPLYIPDFALGRLVETPEEIMAVIDAFLTNNGIITLGPGLVGTLSELTDDLGDQQCDLLQNAGLGHLCTHSSQIWKDALLNDLFGSFWLTVHGNHFSMGSLYAHELPNANASYNNTFLANLSCHGGLNDPQPIGNNWPDLPQAFLGQGGSYLGSTAYTYASWFGVQYSEAIAAAFLENLLVANPPTLGQALVQTKQDYYATYGYLFTYLDEKVLVPTTFYGLPMLQVDTTPLNLVAPLVNPSLPPAYQPNGGIITLPFTRNNLTYDLHTLPDGQYYSYQGQIQTTHYRPVQPQDHEELPADINGAYPHGFTLMQATFSEETNFDPRIAESWILGSSGSLPIEPSVTLSGWDHPFPVYMTQFTGLLATQASLNFILGAYDADRGVERLYENLVGEVLYSDSPDWTPPTLISQVAYTTPNRLIIEVQAHDDSGMAQVVALCADGQGTWTGVNLTRQGQTWQGSCPVQTTQFMAQLVDAAANVTRTPWQIPSGPAIFTLYLPVALQP